MTKHLSKAMAAGPSAMNSHVQDDALLDGNEEDDGQQLDNVSEQLDLDASSAISDESLNSDQLLSAIKEAQKALDLFLGNQFETARAMMEPLADRSVYHSLGFSTICYMQASMTLEQADIRRAVSATKQALRVCQRHRSRKRGGLAGLQLKARSPCDYTDAECHVELCYAELLLEKAVLTFAQDESLMGFVRGGLKIRDCHSAYRLCSRLLRKRQWESEQLKMHFESGARLGEGAFNLLLSLLPPALLRLLQFVGLSGDRREGLRQLRAAADMAGSLRSPLVRVLLLAYHTSFTHVLGSVDLPAVEQLLDPCLKQFPDGALFLYFAGRLHLLSGRAGLAAQSFERSLTAQVQWPQLQQLCRWELMWAMAYAARWLDAAACAQELAGQTRWSRATVLYQRAAFLYQGGLVDSPAVAQLMAEVAEALADCGRANLPVERLAALRAGRFAKLAVGESRGAEERDEDGGGKEQAPARLVLPGLELVYAWNGLPAVGRDQQALAAHLADVQAASDAVDAAERGGDDTSKTGGDDLALVLLLKGACMAELGRHMQAEQCLEQVTEGKLGRVRDRHVTAWAWLELARLRASQGQRSAARKCLESCRSAAKGACLESRIQFRAHAVSLELLEAEEGVQHGDQQRTSTVEVVEESAMASSGSAVE